MPEVHGPQPDQRDAGQFEAPLAHESEAQVERPEDGIEVQRLRDLRNVFSHIEEGDSGDEGAATRRLVYSEQPAAITRYLQDKQPPGSSNRDVAYGAAVLGYEYARSGFGGEAPQSGDAKLDAELARERKDRYASSGRLLESLSEKMHPGGPLTERGLDQVLTIHKGTMLGSTFESIRLELDELRSMESTPDGKKKLPGLIDNMIGRAGDRLRASSDDVILMRNRGEMDDQQAEREQDDMLTMARVIPALDRLRRSFTEGNGNADTPADIQEMEEARERIRYMNVR